MTPFTLPISLDGQLFQASELKVGPVRRAMVGLAELQKGGDTPEKGVQLLDLMAETVALSLRPRHPDMTTEKVQDLTTKTELATVFRQVLTFSGAKEASPGEAQAQVE